MMHVNEYAVLDRCAEEGIQHGWNRAHKHTDTPDPAMLRVHIRDAVMLEICEYFSFDDNADRKGSDE